MKEKEKRKSNDKKTLRIRIRRKGSNRKLRGKRKVGLEEENNNGGKGVRGKWEERRGVKWENNKNGWKNEKKKDK